MRSKIDEAALTTLHPDAQAHVLAGRSGTLEARASQPHSSQALCVDFFGSIEQRPAVRDRIASALLKRAGVSVPGARGPVEIRTEVRGRRQLLNEYGGQESAIDALLRWEGATVTVESKFTEAGFGVCSQAKWRRPRPGEEDRETNEKGQVLDCSGIYGPGSDRKPSTRPESLRLGSPCRLLIQERDRTPRRYWELAPKLFQEDCLRLGAPCLFRGDSFQLMRNLAFAAASAQAGGLDGFGFVGMYVRGAPGGRKLEAQFEVFRRKLQHDVRNQVGLIAYEDAGTLLVELGADDVAAWVQRRIAPGLASRQRTGRARESSGAGR